MENITLESLIEEQQARIPKLHKCDYYPYYDYDEGERTNYQRWLVNAFRFINIKYPNDRFIQEFEEVSKYNLSPEQQTQLLAILESLASLPTIIPSKKSINKAGKEGININLNNTNNQSQNQEQSFVFNLFLEAIKDDLTGRQVKELKQVVADNGNDLEKARPCIIEKLKSFGSDAAANIVANLITNPSIWNWL